MTTQITEELHIPATGILEHVGPDGTVPLRGEVEFYEWRAGPNWTFGKKVQCNPCPTLRTHDWRTGTELYWLRAFFRSGHYSRAVSTSVTMATPTDHTQAATRDEQGLTWPGVSSSVTTDVDGNLTLTSGSTTGTYTSPEVDMGSLARWRVGILFGMTGTNRSNNRKFTGVPWTDLTGLTYEDMRDTYKGLDFRSIDGELVQELDTDGNNFYTPTSSYTLESSIHTVSGAPTYTAHTAGEYYGRYLQFRITLTRTNATDLTITTATNATPIQITTSAAHGLSTGDGCDIHSATVNTAANGNWPKITKVDATNFTLDGSVGNGAGSDGVVVKQEFLSVPTCSTTYSKTPTLSVDPTPAWRNVVAYGAVGDGSTDDLAAVTAAIASLPSSGGVVYFPESDTDYIVSATITVPNRVWLMGDNSFASVIKADPAFSAGTPVIQLGDQSTTVFNVRVMNLGIHCNEVANSIGIYSTDIQEQSGVFNVDINAYKAYGIFFEEDSSPPNNKPNMTIVESVLLIASSAGSLGGIKYDSLAGQNSINNVTIAPAGSPPIAADGILIDGCNANIISTHVENHTDGIHFDNLASGMVSSFTGHSTVVNAVHLDSTAQFITLRNILRNSGTNVILDDEVTLTDTSDTIQFYIKPEITNYLRVDKRLGIGMSAFPTHQLQVQDSTSAIAVVEDTAAAYYIGIRALPGGGDRQMIYFDDGFDLDIGTATNHSGDGFSSKVTVTTTGVNITGALDVSGALTNAVHTHAGASTGGQLNATNVFDAGEVPLARGGAAASLAAVTGLDLIRMNTGGTALEDSGFKVTDLVAVAGDTMTGNLTFSGAVGPLDARTLGMKTAAGVTTTFTSPTQTGASVIEISDFTAAGTYHMAFVDSLSDQTWSVNNKFGGDTIITHTGTFQLLDGTAQATTIAMEKPFLGEFTYTIPAASSSGKFLIATHANYVTSSIEFVDNGLFIENPNTTYRTGIVGLNQTADRSLNIPILAGTDTLMVLDTSQDLAAAKTFTNNIWCYFGDGDLSGIHFDATDMVFDADPQTVGAGAEFSFVNGDVNINDNLKVDVINESTAAAGVTIDGVEIKDTNVQAVTLLSFGDRDTGFWEVADDSMWILAAGGVVATMTATGIAMGSVGGPISLFEVNGSRGLAVHPLSATTLTLDGTHEFIKVDHTATAAVTISLPSATSSWNSGDVVGRTYTIADSGNNAGTNSITINRAGSDTIIVGGVGTSETSVVISGDGDVIRLIAVSSTQWMVY